IIPRTTRLYSPVSIIQNISGLTDVRVTLPFVENPQTILEQIEAKLQLNGYYLEGLSWEISSQNSPRIPTGFVYLLAISLLLGVIVVVRRPPLFMKKSYNSLRMRVQEIMVPPKKDSHN
ncbi:MAG TPA: hypothetical protein VJ044_05655, partial [Candidatus Hodarchaeales archaeon]|nr:hypothetical protein [Candidatus Hodarchaeales archaeon]